MTRWLDGFRVGPGVAEPGAVVGPDGVSFGVRSGSAGGMWLVLLDPERGDVLTELPFPDDYRVGDLFTMTVLGLDPDLVHYAFRVAGRDELLLDPYAKALAGGEEWGVRPRYRSRVPNMDFDWGDDRPPHIPAEDLVVYELNVRGYTRHPSSEVDGPGTFAGLRERIGYLRELGVNCVELLPIAEFDETDIAGGPPRLNTWGYHTVGFFAPKASYGSPRELKELVRDLHAAGIEVVLDVVFNHTAEGDERGPVLSFKGLDDFWYLKTPDGAYYNFSGTGNTVNCNDPVVRGFILDCLRHWVTEYRVDGFRFDLASILTRGADGGPLADPPLLAELAADPVLADVKLIAEAWDAGGLYQVGSFPHHGRWQEWNGRYRDALRRFLVARPGSTGELATALAGSPDLYAGRGTRASVNFVTCHDGFTLADLVSYDHKHNEANGEDNRDGHDANESWNCGVEGPTDDAGVLALRARQTRNALTLLLVSHGVPMLTAGDEFGRTQRGNNNAYCQDNELTWVDWSAAEKNADLVAFVRGLLALRARHPVLRRAAHPDSDGLRWHGAEPGRPDWSADSRLLVAESRAGDDAVLVVANSDLAEAAVRLPEPPGGTRWYPAVDTGGPVTGVPVTGLIAVGKSVVVLEARPGGGGPR
ncbi:glycogen debranching protein GlgX [Saccharothrix violaceirubra]|uniref:Glycogen operon protein n=1 Tax=Saccharothrix violaceirubra TaxID=413306 RepID=A0A7W7WUI6_9PSEU|nr:alpha-amylase family glycosyl hydrolase [Saccharothrix violaceirubra]MBB4963423.1 glycogen operon protein [Saccharothrix violaceirubra]